MIGPALCYRANTGNYVDFTGCLYYREPPMAAGEGRRLTPEGFGKFLRWLSPDDETAVREYQTIRKKLIRFFIHKGCSDPDQLFDETIDIVVGKIESCMDCPNPLAYCYGVAKNVWRRSRRRPDPVPINEAIAPPERVDRAMLEQELKCLDHCVARLSENDRQIVTRYHRDQGRTKIDDRKALAAQLGGVNALRIRVCRIRKDLRVCVVDCLKRSAN